jgi:hypothetical protein
MSGLVCEIIIRGNALQASVQSACQLGTTTYDGEEVMTDADKQAVVDIMTDCEKKMLKVLANYDKT